MYDEIKCEIDKIKGESGWNPGYLWKIKKKISPRSFDPPTAMKTEKGLTTDKKEIKS